MVLMNFYSKWNPQFGLRSSTLSSNFDLKPQPCMGYINNIDSHGTTHLTSIIAVLNPGKIYAFYWGGWDFYNPWGISTLDDLSSFSSSSSLQHGPTSWILALKCPWENSTSNCFVSFLAPNWFKPLKFL